nr:hypothetical protein Iba_chr09aCG5800 [Ipomoea batatas]
MGTSSSATAADSQGGRGALASSFATCCCRIVWERAGSLGVVMADIQPTQLLLVQAAACCDAQGTFLRGIYISLGGLGTPQTSKMPQKTHDQSHQDNPKSDLIYTFWPSAPQLLASTPARIETESTREMNGIFSWTSEELEMGLGPITSKPRSGMEDQWESDMREKFAAFVFKLGPKEEEKGTLFCFLNFLSLYLRFLHLCLGWNRGSPGCKQVRKLEAITHDVEPNQINQEHLPNSQGRVGGGDTESSSSTVLLLSNLKGRMGNIVVGNCLQIRRGGRGALASSFATAAGRFVWEGGEPWRRDADNTTNTVSNNLQLRRSGRNSRYKQDHSFVYG